MQQRNPGMIRAGSGGQGPMRGPSGGGMKPGFTPGGGATAMAGGGGKGGFVICEICDGYIKDLEQLRNHMLWIHKVSYGVANKTFSSAGIVVVIYYQQRSMLL